MWRRRRDRAVGNTNSNPPVPRPIAQSGLPPNTPGVQIFGENYSGPRVLEETDLQVTMERKSKIASVVKSVRIHKVRDPVERLKIQLKELDRALDDGTLDQFEYEEARRTVLEEAKKAIAKKKKHASVKNVEMTPSAFEKEATRELEANDEVQTLLVNNTVVSAVPLNTKSSINQANEVLVHIEDEAEALLRELEATPDLPQEEQQPEQPPTVQAEIERPTEPRVVSAFVIEDVDTNNIVLGEGDFIIDSPPPQPQPTTVEVEDEVPVEIEVEVEEPQVEVKEAETQVERREEEHRASSVIFGGGVMFTVDDTEETNATSPKDEDAELEMLMMGFPAKPKVEKKVETPKPAAVVEKPTPIEKTPEEIEKQQAIEFAFKEENPPNRASEEPSLVIQPVKVKEQAKPTPDPEPDEEEEAPVKAIYGGGMFLNFTEESSSEKKEVTEEDELALLMMDPASTKKKPAAAPNKAKPKPLVIPTLEKPKPKLKPQKKKQLPQKPKVKLSYKESKQAILTKEDEEAMAFLLSGENPTSVVKAPSRTVVNNAMQLVAVEESDSEESDDELRFAGKAKPVFITTANQPSLVPAKKPKKKPKKVEMLYPTEKLELQGPVTKVEVAPQAEVRAKLVHGLLKGMEDEGKTPEQCLTSLKDLVRWKTITEDELELGKQILVKTKGLVL